MLPEKYDIYAINNAGVDVTVLCRGKRFTRKDNGSGKSIPDYETSEQTFINALLNNGGDAQTGVQTNADWEGLHGNVTLTPSGSASGRVQVVLRTLDSSGVNPSDVDLSLPLGTVYFNGTSAVRNIPFRVE